MGKSDVKEYDVSEIRKQFNIDTAIIAKQSELFIKRMQPAYLVNTKEQILSNTYSNADNLLDCFTFYRMVSCTTEKVDDMFSFVSEKMEKLFTTLYAMNKPIVYGIVSYERMTNLVIGIYDEKSNVQIAKSVMDGLLDGVELKTFRADFSKRKNYEKHVGIISTIPSIKIDGERQKFDISPLMKSLNGQDYTVLIVARPVQQRDISNVYGEVIQIRDECFAVSKRNISRQRGTTRTKTNTTGHTDAYSTSTTTTTSAGVGGGYLAGFMANATVSRGHSETEGYSHADSYSTSVANAISKTEGIASDVQNGFALEMIEYANKAIERLKQGKCNGMWETLITYSSDSEVISGIIKASLSGELSKPNAELLPQISHELELTSEQTKDNSILLPKILKEESQMSPLCTVVTSEELGMICSLPAQPVPNFELKEGKIYPLIAEKVDGIEVGKICDGKRKLEHMPFTFSYKDLARHTFVCGITGSGKTTTVKGILHNVDVPFLVIESAKKEYRNMQLKKGKHPIVYTLGKPEINCLRFNPFYIQSGVSPQMHIDFLKDLFNASFSFYGPMPYILEKCLHNVYKNKGWNLTLGFHPYLVNLENSADFFEAEYMNERYQIDSHKYIFPTMQELKQEIERYIEEEMQYEGEVAGNIKTAIKARLESLCSGSKGYMFNTYEFADMQTILNQNAVFELEGLADDSDKAFCVGLLIIFINEYRQIAKETIKDEKPLSHLLVIEEAHRLLKNTSIQQTAEDAGNPKGKAVEHFTNMIAEMRSYGQGVIVAEQIPSKLASDVIKNSSNKVIQRLVAREDQELVANTIGMAADDSLYLGGLETGVALCHKEGMSLPVLVKIPYMDDMKVSDDMLYQGDITTRLHWINCSLVKESVAEGIELYALKLLNSIMVQNFVEVQDTIIWVRKKLDVALAQKGINLVLCDNKIEIYAEMLVECILRYLLNGVYSIKNLASNEMREAIYKLLAHPEKSKHERVCELLKSAYKEEAKYKVQQIVSQIILNEKTEKTDINESIRAYFYKVDNAFVHEVKEMIEMR